MKTAITLSLVFAAIAAIAQTSELPKKEFVIDLSENIIYLKPGERKQITVSILRSKYYAKENATLGFSTALPKEITAHYEPSEGKIEKSVIIIAASSVAAVGTYQIVLNGTLNHVTKGSILKIFVSNENVASKE
ncbi:hypothetical protein BH10BAC4_BH10BAC4_01430 [soil metagenome]